jgi:hypothetical protein
MSSPISYDLQGQGGGILLSSESGSVSGKFRWLQFITDTVLSDIVVSNIVDIDALGGTTIPAGIGIGGMITNVTVTSGYVIAYYV